MSLNCAFLYNFLLGFDMATPAQIRAERERLYDDALTSNRGQLLADVIPALLNLIHESGGTGGGGSGGITQSDVLAALNAASFNTANSTVYETQLAQDDNGLYLIRYNKQTNTSTNITLAGAAYTPVNPRLSSASKATTASFGTIQTTAAGANFVPLTAGACTEVLLLNLEPSAVDLEVRRGASGSTVLLPFGTSMLLEAITDSFDIQVRRADTSNTQVTIRFERRTR